MLQKLLSKGTACFYTLRPLSTPVLLGQSPEPWASASNMHWGVPTPGARLTGGDPIVRVAPNLCLPASSDDNPPQGLTPREAKPWPHHHSRGPEDKEHCLQIASLLGRWNPRKAKGSQDHLPLFLFFSHCQKYSPSICLLSCFSPLMFSASSPFSQALSWHHLDLHDQLALSN